MKLPETKGIMINYYIDNHEGKIASCYREDIKEVIDAFALMKELETELFFDGEEDIDYFDITQEQKKEIISHSYEVSEYTVRLCTKVSWFCLEVNLREKW